MAAIALLGMLVGEYAFVHLHDGIHQESEHGHAGIEFGWNADTGHGDHSTQPRFEAGRCGVCRGIDADGLLPSLRGRMVDFQIVAATHTDRVQWSVVDRGLRHPPRAPPLVAIRA